MKNASRKVLPDFCFCVQSNVSDDDTTLTPEQFSMRVYPLRSTELIGHCSQ